jgi:hypothetical protein
VHHGVGQEHTSTCQFDVLRPCCDDRVSSSERSALCPAARRTRRRSSGVPECDRHPDLGAPIDHRAGGRWSGAEASDSVSSVIGAFALMVKALFILRYLQQSEMRKRVEVAPGVVEFEVAVPRLAPALR